jgi:hypothetical protein
VAHATALVACSACGSWSFFQTHGNVEIACRVAPRAVSFFPSLVARTSSSSLRKSRERHGGEGEGIDHGYGAKASSCREGALERAPHRKNAWARTSSGDCAPRWPRAEGCTRCVPRCCMPRAAQGRALQGQAWPRPRSRSMK